MVQCISLNLNMTFQIKYPRIEALVKPSYKPLKTVLILGAKKLGPIFIALKLDKFLLFKDFFDFSLFDFINLDHFWNLANFWLFNFPNFLACSTLLPPNLTSSLPLFFLNTGLLLLFFLKVNLSDYSVIFNIKINKATILLKP